LISIGSIYHLKKLV